MSKIEDKKAKVGRPKMAGQELVKDSWCKIACGALASVVLTICLVGQMTQRTPFQVLTFQKIDLLTGTASIKTNDDFTINKIDNDDIYYEDEDQSLDDDNTDDSDISENTTTTDVTTAE